MVLISLFLDVDMVAIDIEFDCVARVLHPQEKHYPELLQIYTEYSEAENKGMESFLFFIF